MSERPPLDPDTPEPPAKRLKTRVVCSEDLLADKSFFCAQIAPSLGLATSLLMRMVASRFAEWLKPKERPRARDVLLDMIERGLGRAFEKVAHHNKSTWARLPLISTDRDVVRRWLSDCKLPPLAPIWTAIAALNTSTWRHYTVIDELVDLLPIATTQESFDAALLPANHLLVLSLMSCALKRGRLHTAR